MYDIPSHLIKQRSSTAGVRYGIDDHIYSLNIDAVPPAHRRMYSQTTIDDMATSMQVVSELVNTPIYREALEAAGRDSIKAIRDVILRDFKRVNDEIRRLLHVNGNFIGTKQMKALMTLSDTYTMLLDVIADEERRDVRRKRKMKANVDDLKYDVVHRTQHS